MKDSLMMLMVLAAVCISVRADDVHAAGTWLPGAAVASDGDVDVFLKSLEGRVRVLGCRYNGAQLQSVEQFVNGTLASDGVKWTCKVRAVATKNNGLDMTAAFKLAEGSVKDAGVALAFDFSGWSTNNYILVPAMIYGGNRFRILNIGYPPYIHNESDRPLDMPVTTTDILHLNPDGSHAKLEMNTGNVSTPMLSFYNPKEDRGFILLAEQGTRFGNNGLFVEEDAGPKCEKKRATFVVSAPGVRGQKYCGCGRADSGDRGAAWSAGDELTLNFKVYNFGAADMPAFFDKVFEVRKALTGRNGYACVTPYSVAAALITEHHDKEKWAEKGDKSYYCNSPGNPSVFAYQIGWNGVPVYGFPCLVAETPERLRRVGLSLDNMLVRGGQGKTGLYYAISKDGEIFGDDFGKQKERPGIAMIRRSAETLYFGLRSLELMKQRGHADRIKPEWEASFRSCAGAFVKVWKDYGQFGQFIDVDTGKMDINGSTAGSLTGAAMALASRYFQEPRYLELAETSMRMYYERDLAKGYCGGGPAEILQAPDSESAANYLESCIALYEVTGKKEWLARSEYAARLLSTWVMSYDYQFPKESDMARAGVHAAGSIFASSQNNHSAPGYYILSGDMLLKLFRATGDRRYAELYKDQSHNVVQYVGAPHNPLRRRAGAMTERVQVSDWEGNNVGMHDANDSNMAWETLGALSCQENPGIYLHTDDDTVLVMDHVEAEFVKSSRGSGTRTIRIKNPTPYDASVSIFAESGKQARIPLGWGASDKWPRVEVKAGETKIAIVSEAAGHVRCEVMEGAGPAEN